MRSSSCLIAGRRRTFQGISFLLSPLSSLFLPLLARPVKPPSPSRASPICLPTRLSVLSSVFTYRESRRRIIYSERFPRALPFSPPSVFHWPRRHLLIHPLLHAPLSTSSSLLLFVSVGYSSPKGSDSTRYGGDVCRKPTAGLSLSARRRSVDTISNRARDVSKYRIDVTL